MRAFDAPAMSRILATVPTLDDAPAPATAKKTTRKASSKASKR
jgi:hypothetical protein